VTIPNEIVRLPIEDEVTALACSPSGTLLATSSFSSGVRLWNTESWKRSLDLDGQEKSASCITFSPNSQLLAIGDLDSTIYIFDVTSRKCRRLGTLPYPPTQIAFSKDARLLATADYRSNITIREVHSGKDYWSFQAHKDPETKRVGVQGLAFLPNSDTLITAGTDGMVRCWNTRKKEEALHFEGKVGEVNAMAVSPDGKLVAVAGGTCWHPRKPGGIRIWEIATRRQIAERGPLDHGVSCIAFSDDSRMIVAGTYGPPGDIFTWPVAEH
jgi:WD40 repeat protein